MENKSDWKSFWFFIYIGIDNTNGKYLNKNFSDSSDKGMYAWNLGDALYRWNASTIRTLPFVKNKGDIITMILRFKGSDGILSFRVNNDEEDVAERKVTKEHGLNYRFAIAMAERGCSYQIIN